MSIRQFLGALLVTVVAISAFDVLLNAVVLRSAFAAAASYWRPTAELNRLVPLGLVALAGTTAVHGGLLVASGWVGVRRGLIFGTWLGVASAVGVLGLISLVPWPVRLVLAMATQQLVNGMIGGSVFGWFAARVQRKRLGPMTAR